nr:reverse transcriptase domain-containing protein [Tanacetum cinerariifolium]
MLKFPVEGGIITICSTILIPTECTSVITSSVIPREERTLPANFKVALHPNFPDQEVVIGGTLSGKGRTDLCSVLKKNLDIFAWQPSDMTGVPRSIAEHQLNIREGYSPVRQKKRGQAPERGKAIQAEDCYPLPEINWKVESLCGYLFKFFLDAYKGYHQIQLAEADEEKTAFHTGQGVYCYTKMPFGLKNVGATYQRLMDKAFEGQIGRNIEVNVDDLVVKSYTEAEMMRDIKKTFRTLRKVNMKLNPKKCLFGLAEGVFLGYVITPEGIKPCPDKTAAVLQLPSSRTIKEVQSLNGNLASLNRFLSKSAEKSMPLFQTLKKYIKKSDFHWTVKAEQAFQQLKQHLSEIPLLVAPKPQEGLIIYLSATYGAISACKLLAVASLIFLQWEQPSLGTTFTGSGNLYCQWELSPGSGNALIKPCPDKMTAVLQLPSPQTIKEVQSLNGNLASLNRFLSKSAEKSLPLFQTLKKCIKKSDFRWTTEAEQVFQQLKQHLSALLLLAAPKPQEELIMYLSATHGAISAVLLTERGTAQTPVYFISRALQGPELNYSPMEKLVLSLVFAAKRLQRYFQAHPIAVITDQPFKQVMSRPDAAGRLQKWSIMLGEHNITYRLRTSIKGQILADFLNEMPSNASQASNNEAEYEALIAGLRIATQMGVKNIQANVDSKLVANQVLGTYIAREENMIKYLDITKDLVSGFKTFSISQVPRSKNKKADDLSKIASTSFAHLSKQVLVEVLETKSITEKEVTAVIEEEGPTWMTELMNYLKEGTLPKDEKEARKIRLKARHMHAGPRSVVAKAIRLGYFWPTMHKDAQDMIRKCSDCQIHRPFPDGPGKVKFLIVAMDYFTKWIEAKAVATITDGQVKKFVWDNIVCRFGISGEIISDNGKQFADNPFKDWCDKLNITQHFASVKHPQSNGLVERENRSLEEGIKARLGEGNKNSVEELPHGSGRNVLGIHDHPGRDKTVPRQNRSYATTLVLTDNQRVITNQPIKQIISRLDVAGRLQKWVVMLGEHNITYRTRTSVKGQILADFLVEEPDEAPPDTSVVEIPQEAWILFTDGSSCVDGSEYEALIAGLQIAAQMGVRNVHVSVDYKLMANQVLGTYVAKEENMVRYLEKAKSLIIGFANFSISQVLRRKNKKADALSKIASTSFAHLSKQVLVEASFLKLWLRCVGPLEEYYVIRDIHEGSCSMHAEPRSVVAKAMRLGYYWLTMHRDAQDMIRTCNACQIHRPVRRNPQQPLTLITNPWPFYKWGIDIADPFPEGPEKVRFFSSYGLFHKVDRGESRGNKHWKSSEEVRVGQHSMPLQSPRRNSLEQWNQGPSQRGKQELDRRTSPCPWARRTMIKSSHGETLFSLTYGTKAVIPAEIRMPTYRTTVVDAMHNDEELRLHLDLLEERRERAVIRKAKAKLKMTKYYNARVRGVTFKPGDFVYCSNDASHAVDEGKLGPKWEGPYEATKALGDGAFKLRSTDGTVLPRTWNIANLKSVTSESRLMHG